uniref:Ribosomal protein S10 n=1 Tax=Thraustotheca clavata TaxID=74557 RepID=S5TQ92_9STRA|nr:ribosomal protein S10 [Thraustotheca clavata]AGS55534.1 ribosomal protein S10 [Thraustotheca clavata]
MYTLKLTIKSLQNLKNIKFLLHKIQQFLKNKNILIKGNISQKKNTIYTVLRSPHVYKKSQEHFNYNYYKQTFHILNHNLYILIYFLIIIKKIIPQNVLLKTKIKKN